MPKKTAPDPRFTVVIIGDDGKLYKLEKDDWKTEKHKLDDNAAGVVAELRNFGTYLAFLPDVAVGVGLNCTVVNLEAILKK